MNKTIKFYLGYFSSDYAILLIIALLVFPISFVIIHGWSFSVANIVVVNCGVLYFYFTNGAKKLHELGQLMIKGKIFLA